MDKNTALTRKFTFYLPVSLIDEIKGVIKEGIAPSQNAFVQKALMREIRRAKDKLLREEFREAADDPLFLQDLKDTEQAFESADAETARMIQSD